VFAQLIEHLPHKEFHKCVARYGGNRYAKNSSCWSIWRWPLPSLPTVKACGTSRPA